MISVLFKIIVVCLDDFVRDQRRKNKICYLLFFSTLIRAYMLIITPQRNKRDETRKRRGRGDKIMVILSNNDG